MFNVAAESQKEMLQSLVEKTQENLLRTESQLLETTKETQNLRAVAKAKEKLLKSHFEQMNRLIDEMKQKDLQVTSHQCEVQILIIL